MYKKNVVDLPPKEERRLNKLDQLNFRRYVAVSNFGIYMIWKSVQQVRLHWERLK